MKGVLPPFDHTGLLLLSLSHDRFCVQVLSIPHRAVDIMGASTKRSQMLPFENIRLSCSQVEICSKNAVRE